MEPGDAPGRERFSTAPDELCSKHHAELSAAIERDFEQLKTSIRSCGINDFLEKITVAHGGFSNCVKNFAALAQAEVKLGPNEKLGLSGSLRTAAGAPS